VAQESKMRLRLLFAIAIFFAATFAWGQAQPPSESQGQTTTPPSRSQMRAQRRQQMQAFHQQQIAAMRADLDKLKKSLAAMQANIPNIKDINERARWQDNIDMWQVLINHMDRMVSHMEQMGPGGPGAQGMRGPGMGPGMGMGPGPGGPATGTSNPPPTK
jgi:uncharacterized protein HemX